MHQIRRAVARNIKLICKNIFIVFTLLSFIIPSQESTFSPKQKDVFTPEIQAHTLASRSISLENRDKNKFVNEVFKDNILLTLNYLEKGVKNKSEIVWSDIKKPRSYKFDLAPGDAFAFHDQIFEGFNNVVKTTNAHFNYQDGFKSSGYLYGDGVCHLASILNWVSYEAGLSAYSPTNHNFAKINEVPKEYGVSIFYQPKNLMISAKQNLYITNNLNNTVTFILDYDGKNLGVEIVKENSTLLGYLQ